MSKKQYSDKSMELDDRPRTNKHNKQTALAGRHYSISMISCAFLENSTFLKKFLSRFLREQQDIEDVVQETYLRAYNAEQKKDIEQPKAFLFQIAKNLALSELNRKTRQVTEYIEDVDPGILDKPGSTTEEELEAREHIALFCEAIATLPERRRRVCLLRKVHGLPYKDIAEREGITVSAVEKHLLKGMLSCRTYIRKKEQGQLAGSLRKLARPTLMEDNT